MAAKRKASKGYSVVKDWRPGVDMLACDRCDYVIEDPDRMAEHVEEHVKAGGKR